MPGIRLEPRRIKDHPLGETMVSRTRYLATHMKEDWDDGSSRSCHPPFDALLLMLRKIETESARGVVITPDWQAHAWFGRLQALSSRLTLLSLTERRAYENLEDFADARP